MRTWQSRTARILARTIPGELAMAGSPAQLAAAGTWTASNKIVRVYNEFDISGSVRPQLVLSYETTGAPLPVTPATPRTATPPSTTAPSGAPEGWRLVWGDDFTGDTLDRSRWNLRNNEARDVDLGCNVDSPRDTFLGGGTLTLRALRENATCGSQTRQYTQPCLDTIGTASFTYGGSISVPSRRTCRRTRRACCRHSGCVRTTAATVRST